MDGQDWTPVVVKKFIPKTTIVQKFQNHDAIIHKKLENDDIHVKPKMLSNESRNSVIQFRITNKLTQADLDGRCSFPRNTIQQLEANKRAPSTKELQTLNRILKTGLTLAN